ncbi:MAG: 5'-3' exonuclease H3TH domain-containing protein, partial [Patescibacteria group bacterium]
MRKFLLIDLFNLMHRAYHALPKEFSDKDGNPTNAIYGVSSMLINVLQQVSPDYVCAVLDTEKPTFRHVDFTGYKAHRRPTEDMLSVQIPKIKEIVEAFGIKMVSSPGYEADDLVGTLAVKNQDCCQMILLSNDRDLWQLVSPNIVVMLPSTRGDKIEWIGEKEVVARLGVTSAQVPDYKGLVGDPSDNIPGVYGIGGKSAGKLMADFGSVEEIYKNIDKVTPESLRKKLIDGYEQAIMSKKLATLDLNTPVEFSREDSRYEKM